MNNNEIIEDMLEEAYETWEASCPGCCVYPEIQKKNEEALEWECEGCPLRESQWKEYADNERRALELVGSIVDIQLSHKESEEFKGNSYEMGADYSSDWLEMIDNGQFDSEEEKDSLYNYFDDSSHFYEIIRRFLEKRTDKGFYWTRDGDFDWVIYHEE